MALSHHDNLELMIGDDWVINGLLLDEDGEPLDLNSSIGLGWALVGPDGNQLPGLADVATLAVQDGGIVVITVPDSFTRTLRPARYMDAIRVTVGDAQVTQWTGLILTRADPFHPTVDIMPPVPQEPAFEDPPDDGELYVRKGSEWVKLPSGFSTRFEYQFDDKITAPPLNSQLRLDNADPTLATKIWMHNNDADGLDVSNLLQLVEQDFILFLQDKDDPAKRARYHATGPMVNLGNYCELPVVFVAGLGALNNNQRCFVMVYGGG